jgi:hypothetical protein
VGFHRSPDRPAAERNWRRFVERNAQVIDQAGIPPAVTATIDAWDDVLLHGSLTANPDGFAVDRLNPAQYASLVTLTEGYFAAGYEFYMPSALRLEDQEQLRARFLR